jgi:hypothetical protein
MVGFRKAADRERPCATTIALYAVKVPMVQFKVWSTRVYWIEYRTNVGFDGIVRVLGNGIQIRVSGGDFRTNPQAWLTDHKVFVPGDTFTDGTIAMDVTGPGQVRIRQVAQV